MDAGFGCNTIRRFALLLAWQRHVCQNPSSAGCERKSPTDLVSCYPTHNILKCCIQDFFGYGLDHCGNTQ